MLEHIMYSRTEQSDLRHGSLAQLSTVLLLDLDSLLLGLLNAPVKLI